MSKQTKKQNATLNIEVAEDAITINDPALIRRAEKVAKQRGTTTQAAYLELVAEYLATH